MAFEVSSVPLSDTIMQGYLHAWETGSQAKAGIGRWITFYNHQRPHAAHGGQPPAVVYFSSIETDQQARRVA
jgi:putative transposase